MARRDRAPYPRGDIHELHYSFGSHCIDAGSNLLTPFDTFDLDGDGDTAERLPLDLFAGPPVLRRAAGRYRRWKPAHRRYGRV